MQDTLLEMTLVFEVASGDATNFWISLDLKECRCLLQRGLLPSGLKVVLQSYPHSKSSGLKY